MYEKSKILNKRQILFDQLDMGLSLLCVVIKREITAINNENNFVHPLYKMVNFIFRVIGGN